ncbi:MAG: NAD-dependent epimerase/dehydratase family protein [Rhizobiaceae bacterium]|nr:NAD-dependent epimerase/dehydratase family protein [Rhizobiaceae bacterium]
MKKAIVLGAGGFIGSHLVKNLKNDGYWVRGADLKLPEFSASAADDFAQGDLRNKDFVENIFDQEYDEVYQLAADMGGAGYIFTGENDADIMHNSALINLNVLDVCKNNGIKRVFYSSSACIYPQVNQIDPANPNCEEKSAYPAHPDSEYGWEKLFSERLFISYNRNYGMQNRIARYHNIFGPEGTWNGGREKAPAAMCRKVAEAKDNSTIEVWGDGLQTRSFLFVDECLEGTKRLLRSDVDKPLNIGSEEMVSINELAQLVIDISGKNLTIENIEGPLGVRGRNSDNRLIRGRLNWAPSRPLQMGLEATYAWISQQLESAKLAG